MHRGYQRCVFVLTAILTETPDFDPVEPTINVNIRPRQDEIEMEWDVVGCQSFKQETGKWAKLRPGELVPT
ncbi:MAG: hypothetical protein EAZ59_11425 [Oscillatoriales cyanobacterium]|nr:MAG: hypothetical protein EAZ59_11425 [Oscillatoriales cyanobacterium]